MEQDKPRRPPPKPASALPRVTRFGFRFDPLMRVPALLVGVTDRTSGVEVGTRDLSVWFGPWRLETPLTNVTDVSVTGPYSFLKVVGPPHLSLADGGITFATSTAGGVCIRLEEAVPAALPVGLLRHGSVTVTVDDPDGLAEELQAAVRRATHAERKRGA